MNKTVYQQQEEAEVFWPSSPRIPEECATAAPPVRYPRTARDTRNVKRTKNGDSARVL